MSIKKALFKHGYSNFSLEILEYVRNNVVTREQYYLDLLKPEYNVLKIAGSSLGYKHTEEAKVIMRALNKTRFSSEEARANLKKKALGRLHTEDVIAKLREMATNRVRSEESKAKTSATMGTSVKVFNVETQITNIYCSKRKAAKGLNTSLDTVRRYIISQNLYKGIYLIENLIVD